MKLETAKTLLECIEQGVDQTGDWRVALEQAAEIAKTLVEELSTSGLTAEEEAELADLEAEFEEAGGRGVELAERIDELRAKQAGQYTWNDWQSEEEELGSDGREGVYWIEISDPNGEEIASIIHRTVGGQFPLDGDVAKGKEAEAQRIVDALNRK